MNNHTFSNGNDWESSKNTWSFVFVFQIVKNHLARKVTLYKSVHIKYKFVLKPNFALIYSKNFNYVKVLVIVKPLTY